MHDFSIDWIVRVSEFESFVNKARTVLRQGGGLLPDSAQTMQQGGCAANTATTLATLGVATHFICRTDEVGLHMMQYYLGSAGVHLDHVKTDGDHARVMVLEVGKDATNIMVNDQDSFAPFGFSDLDESDLELISEADLVGIFDWTLNGQGTDLAARLLSSLGSDRPVTYLDTSDPAPRAGEVPELYEQVLSHGHLDHLSVNEHELRQYTGATAQTDSLEELLELSNYLNGKLHANVNVHTSRFSIAFENGSLHVVPTYDIEPRRSTGAGDTWNGANLAGMLMGLSAPERLLLANATAAYYVESMPGARPSRQEVARFIEDRAGDLRPLGRAGA